MGVKILNKVGSSSQTQARQGKVEPPAPACQLKITILGGQTVGKTALVSRFIEGAFQQEYVSTIINRHHKRVSFKDKPYGLDIIDPAGYQVLRQMDLVEQEAYHAVDGFVVVYSICDPDSLKTALRAYRRAATKVGSRCVPTVLVGTQADVRDNALSPIPVVSAEDARKAASDEGFCHWMEVTATNCSPHSAFRILVSNIANARDSIIWENDYFPTHSVPPSPTPSHASQVSKKSGLSRFFSACQSRSLSCPEGTRVAKTAVLSRKRRSIESLQSVRNSTTPDIGRKPSLRPSSTHSSLSSGASLSSFYPNETPSVTPNPGMALRVGRQMRRPMSMALGAAADFFMDGNSASAGGSNEFFASDCPPPLPPKTVVYRDGCLVIKVDNETPQAAKEGEAIYEEVDLSRLSVSSNYTGVPLRAPPPPPIPPTPPPRPKQMPPLHSQGAGSVSREDSDSDSMPLSKIGSTSTDTSSSGSEISRNLTRPPTPTHDRMDRPQHSLSRSSSLYGSRPPSAKPSLKDSEVYSRPSFTCGAVYVRNTNSGEISEEEGDLNAPGPLRRAGTFRVKPARGGIRVKGLTTNALLGKLKAKASAWA